MTPVHEHDCTYCIYLGADTRQEGEPQTNQVDMYIHLDEFPERGYHVLIRRYSSVGKDYGSWGMAGFVVKRYQRVLDAAREQGVI